MSSPLKRAVHTAALVGEAAGAKNIVPTEHLIPGLSDNDLLVEINAHASPTTLLVGHEPQLRTFLVRLIGDGGMQFQLRKGTLVCIDCREPVGYGSGTLRWLLTNEEMGKGGDSHSRSSG